MRKNVIIMTALLLGACSTMPSRQESMQQVNAQFTGHNVNAFFVSYGMAAGQPEKMDDGKTYHWVSVEPSSAGTVAEHTHIFAAPGGKHYGFIDTPPPDALEGRYCRIDIHTDKQNIIHEIVFIGDTPGKHSASDCAEIFGTKE